MNNDQTLSSNIENNVSQDTKLKEEGLKKQNSYTYWTRDIKSNNDVSSKINPVKIDDYKSESSQENNKSVGSAWNMAGTWEEKHFTKQQVKDFFEKLLPIGFKNFVFKKVTSISGDTFLVFSRGKIKICYDNEMNFDVSGLNEFSMCEGSIKISDITNSEGDSMEFEYKFSGENASKFKEVVKSEKALIESCLRSIYNKMKE